MGLSDADWCKVMYYAGMASSKPSVRQSVSLPSRVVRRVQALAKRQRTSASRVIVELIETGLEAREQEKKQFLALADRLVHSSDLSEQRRLKDELARMTFGE
jgi:metal-responsive CopG/Arc/MetJ family transcriptional regulator